VSAIRTSLAALALVALATAPGLAQGKTKAAATNEHIAALETCERFARNETGALEAAIAEGWDAYEVDSESPYVVEYAASRDLDGIGLADIFVLIESYPELTFGYCRLDLSRPERAGQAAIEEIAALDRYDGEVLTNAEGTYASLSGTDASQSLLLTHWTDADFVIQLTTVTPLASN
jgi:hypothetical protein